MVSQRLSAMFGRRPTWFVGLLAHSILGLAFIAIAFGDADVIKASRDAIPFGAGMALLCGVLSALGVLARRYVGAKVVVVDGSIGVIALMGGLHLVAEGIDAGATVMSASAAALLLGVFALAIGVYALDDVR